MQQRCNVQDELFMTTGNQHFVELLLCGALKNVVLNDTFVGVLHNWSRQKGNVLWILVNMHEVVT